jgi:hypothetical protein
MIDRSNRGGVGTTNMGGELMRRMYPAKPPKKKSPISALAETMASTAVNPAKFARSAVKGVAGTIGRAGQLLSGENPYKKK